MKGTNHIKRFSVLIIFVRVVESVMVENNSKTVTKGINTLTLALIVVIAILAALGIIFTPQSGTFLPAIEDIVDTLLGVATSILYLLGGMLVFFGAVLVTIRFIQTKLKDAS